MRKRSIGFLIVLAMLAFVGSALGQSTDEVKQKAAKVSSKARSSADKKMEASAKDLDRVVISDGEDKVAARLGTQFGMTPEAITAEKNQLATSWGNLTIAHTLAANAKGDITVAQLVQMHDSGMGWGQIAAGLGFKLGETISAVRAEDRVAKGLSKPSGKVATIHGEGSKAGPGKGVAHEGGSMGGTKMEHGGGKGK